jgi:hypothetical protein
VGGGVTVTDTGRVSPGDRSQVVSETGNLTLDGGLTMTAGGTYLWNLTALSTASPGTNFDVLTVRGGNTALGGTSKLTLEFNMFGVSPNTADPFWTQPRQWRILDVTAGGTNAGNTTFSQITNPTFAAGTFTLLDPATQGGDIVLQFTPVPEPATVGTMAVGLLAARLTRRRFARFVG